MKDNKILQFLKNNILILDGATGTEMHKRGLPGGVCPEYWGYQHPDIIADIHKAYLQAGSQAFYTTSFCANRIKLAEFGYEKDTYAINLKLAQIARSVAGNDHFVGGDITSTGQFVKPMGMLSFREAVEVYQEQARGLIDGGVDFIIIETMIDIQETRAAMIGIRELTDLPIFTTMTFDGHGKTLTGTDALTVLLTLQSLGADAVGCNCSTGPEEMIPIIRKMKEHAAVYLLAKPNAGIPSLKDGITHFPMGPEEFSEKTLGLIEAGVNAIGGCCGITPEHIHALASKIRNLNPISPKKETVSSLTSLQSSLLLDLKQPVKIIGERINPTGKKLLQAQLKEEKYSQIVQLAFEQTEAGAEILDVNVGMPGIDEKNAMIRLLEQLALKIKVPLCIDSSNPDVIEEALQLYPGRALINSISAEKHKLEKLLPLAAKYGAMFILLPLDDNGIPETALERINLVNLIYEKARCLGMTKKNIVVDGLVMSVSSNKEMIQETLQLVAWCAKEGFHTVLGLSNVSFGLPERQWVNACMLALAVEKGLSLAIANPSNPEVMHLKRAAEVLTLREGAINNYIACYGNQKKPEKTFIKDETPLNPAEKAYQAVLKGQKDSIIEILKELIRQGKPHKEIMDKWLIPAITEVGQLYEKKIYFLPQLIESGETMKKGVDYLESIAEKIDDGISSLCIVIATVKGDIHDIGKNIVALLLRNHGFRVYDLGKDVNAGDIIGKAREVKADLVGLSALMTTTMVEMKKVIDQARQEELSVKFMIGGAVVTQKYADEIQADGYARDAYSAVKLAKELLGKP